MYTLPVNNNKKTNLIHVIADLAAFTLDNAGYKAEYYAFYLDVAKRHQMYLQKEKIEHLISQMSTDEVDLSDDAISGLLTSLAQNIVTEVIESANDDLATKLLKNSYFSNLDKAHNSSAHAYRYLTDGHVENNDEMTHALQKYNDLLNVLIQLPFAIEQLLYQFPKNAGYNFCPLQATKMLSGVLGVMGKATGQEGLAEAVNTVIHVLMPNIPADINTIELINNHLIVFLHNLLDAQANFTLATDALFPKDKPQLTKARKNLLATMDVHFDSIETILSNTLLKPAEQASQSASLAFGIADEAVQLMSKDNIIDIGHTVIRAFRNFTVLANQVDSIDPQFLPSWTVEANQYYQQLALVGNYVNSVTQPLLTGLGEFYNYTLSCISSTIANYFTQLSDLNLVLNGLDDQVSEVLLIYIAFYELCYNAQIIDASHQHLKEKLFASYIQQIHNGDTHKQLAHLKLNFADYCELEQQLFKDQLAPNMPLAERIETAGSYALSQSLISYEIQQSIENEQLTIILLINRLKTLEEDFDPTNPLPTFSEFQDAIAIISEHPEYQGYNERFLQPAHERMIQLFYKTLILPRLEQLLDSHDPALLSVSHTLRLVYSELQDNKTPSKAHWKTLLHLFGNPADNILREFIIPASPRKTSYSITPAKTPRELSGEAISKRVNQTSIILKNVFPQIQIFLDNQKNRCDEIAELSNNDAFNTVCKAKSEFIGALNQFINFFSKQLENPESIIELVDDTTHLVENFTGSSVVKNLFKILPELRNYDLPIEQILLNILYRYKDNNDWVKQIEAIDAAEKTFLTSLKKNPFPIFINELNHPLSPSNSATAEDQIMTVIIDSLSESLGKTALTWGSNHLASALGSLTLEHLRSLLPHPLIADLAFNAMQSSYVQQCIAPIYNQIKNKFDSSVEFYADKAKDILKEKLYPILGIQIQRSIEETAFQYVKNQNPTNLERDAFSLFYLQYKVLKTADKNPTDLIAVLFPNLLEKLSDEQKIEISHQIIEKFDQTELLIDASQQLEAADNTLEFLLAHTDLADGANIIDGEEDPQTKNLVQIALLNRLIVAQLHMAQELSPLLFSNQKPLPANDKINTLQIDAVTAVSSFLAKVNALNASAETKNTFINPMNDAIEETRAIEILRAKKALKVIKEITNNKISYLNDLKKSNYLGLNGYEAAYRNATFSNKAWVFLSWVFEAYSLISTWAAILSPLLIAGGLLQSLAIAGGVASAATGVGAILLISTIALRVAYKFGWEIYYRKEQFDTLEGSFFQKNWQRVKLVTSALLVASFKAVFTDLFMVKLTYLLALSPIQRFRDAFRKWPSLDKIESEITPLVTLNQQIKRLDENLDSKQLPDDSVLQLMQYIGKVLNKRSPELPNNDARITDGIYPTLFDATTESIKNCRFELLRLSKLLEQEKNLKPNVPAGVLVEPVNAIVIKSEPLILDKPIKPSVEVNLQQYLDTRAKKSESDQSPTNHISYFWNFLFKHKQNVQQLTESYIPLDESFVPIGGQSLHDSTILSTKSYLELVKDFEPLAEQSTIESVAPRRNERSSYSMFRLFRFIPKQENNDIPITSSNHAVSERS